MDYTILILALPMLSFLLLALAGMKMPHRVAGTIGTTIVRSGSRAELSDGIQLFLCPTHCRRPLPYADSVEH